MHEGDNHKEEGIGTKKSETIVSRKMNATLRNLLQSRCYANAHIGIPFHRVRMSRYRMKEFPVGSPISRTHNLTSFSSRSLASEGDLTSPSVSSYIVIGNGPIGASVAKHLTSSLVKNANRNNGISEQAVVVTIVDGRPMGMGSSHSDRARLIRTFDAEGDLDWTRWNRRSLEAFPEIERLWNESGRNVGSNDENRSDQKKSFFTKCGALLIGNEEFVTRSKKAVDESLSSSMSSSNVSLLSPAECERKWPYLKPKLGCDVSLFDSLGGIIDPLAFIEAQNHNAISLCSAPGFAPGDGNRNDGSVHLDIYSGVASKLRKNGTAVELDSGKLLIATEKIILCGGAYSRSLLGESEIESSTFSTLRACKRTVALLEVSRESVEGILQDMPTIKYAFGLERATTGTSEKGEHGRVEAGSVYILPPVCYPEREGKWFVKVGGGPNDFFDEGNQESEREQFDDWLASGGDPSSAEWLGDIGKSLMPGVDFKSMQSMACITTTSLASNGIVVDDVLGNGSLIGVSACQGKGAGPSDALGKDIVRSIL